MPFYEYECQACKYYCEVMQKISDAPLTKCPSCGKQQLKKLLSAPVFRLKGAGWYETDFKSDKENKRNLVGADKEEAVKSDAKAPEAKEAKPEAKEAKEPKESREAKDSKGSKDSKDSRTPEPKSGTAGRAASGTARAVRVSSKATRRHKAPARKPSRKGRR
jgi:putative FmdB family regulatory protein